MSTRINTRQGKIGTRYTALYEAPDGSWLSAGTFGDKRAAERAADVAADKADNQQWVDPRSGKALFKTFVDKTYRPVMGSLEPTTKIGYESKLRVHLLPYWGDRTISSIKPTEVQAWVSDPYAKRAGQVRKSQGSTRSVAMTKHCFTLLSTIMSWAVRDGLILTNPCANVRLPTAAQPEVKVMTPEVFDALLEALGSETHRRMFLVAMSTGMRWSELVGLTPTQIDFPRRRLTIDRSIVKVTKAYGSEDGSRWHSKPYPKGKKPRSVQIDDTALEALAAAIGDRGLDAKSEQIVFTSSRGNPVDSSRFMAGLQPALDKVSPDVRYTMKHLRSSYCSWLLEGGAPIAVVQSMMGHAQITTTQKYIAVLPEAESKALSAFQAVRRRSS